MFEFVSGFFLWEHYTWRNMCVCHNIITATSARDLATSAPQLRYVYLDIIAAIAILPDVLPLIPGAGSMYRPYHPPPPFPRNSPGADVGRIGPVVQMWPG
jgi:hypothetical protein